MFQWRPFVSRTGPSARAGFVPPPRSAERLAKVVTLLATVAALAVPSVYFAATRTRVSGLLGARAEVYAAEVLDSTEQNPALWNTLLDGSDIDLTNLAVATSDAGDDNPRPPEQRQVFARGGREIIFVPAPRSLGWPTLFARAPVVQNGHQLGEVEITRSLRPMLILMLPITAGSLAFGLLLLIVMRVVPLRLLREALDRAHYISAHDMLTGLPNRALFGDRLEQALLATLRNRGSVAMLCLDLDHFKEVNDTLGHACGDMLLRTVALRMRECLREGDTLARLGGDEFAVIAPAVRQPGDAETLSTRLIEAVRRPVPIDGQQIFVGLSVGIAIGGPDSTGGELVKQADLALYQAKENGRGGYCFFEPEMDAKLRRRRALENDLRAALAAGEISVNYQPQIAVASGRIIGAEALMRWNRSGSASECGLHSGRDSARVAPDIFIPIAEETGLIGQLGGWVLNQACGDAILWPEHMQVAVNVSPVQFRLGGFLETVRDALASSGLDPRRLELEVTEGILLNDTEETLAILSSLRDIGVKLAMDDFGTGYASLGYLQKFRFDKIKIDRSFIKNLGNDANAAAIVRAVVGLSEELGMTTNAEGVENQQQMELLRGHGCSEVQGYLFWAPMPCEEFQRLIEPPGGERRRAAA